MSQCIDNFARSIGYNTSSDLPDKVLQFVRDHPLMDNSACALKRNSNYTRIVVDGVTGLDKQTYDVMFLGTDDGYLHKAFTCDGEMFIVEELQLFLSPETVPFLQLSCKKGMLYVGSSCQLLYATDTNTAWIASWQEILTVHEYNVRKLVFPPENDVHLKCVPLSNLARVVWKFNGSRLQEDSKHLLCDGGIPKFNVIMDEGGFSGCLSVEKSKGKEFLITGACCALYVHQNTEKANINAATNKYNEAGAEGFKSSVPASLLKEATKQKAVDSQKEKVVLKLLGAGFALLFLICLEFLQGSFISALEDLRKPVQKPPMQIVWEVQHWLQRDQAAKKESSATQMDTSFVNE
ncbi:Semaphorin-4E-like protein [Aix galericulata]|nr:Semaphorin-4E-like protein [Aix galericulata]